MGSVFFFSLLILLKTMNSKCSDLEAMAISTLSQPSVANNSDSDLDNKVAPYAIETGKGIHTCLQEGSSSVVPEASSGSSIEELTSKIQASSKDSSSVSVIANTVDDTSTEATDHSENNVAEEHKQPLIIDLASLPYIRVKRDDDEELVNSPNSDESIQDDTFDQQETGNSEDSQSQSDSVYFSSNKEIGNVEEEPEDSTIEESPEIWEESVGDAELRDERNADSKEILEGTKQRQGKMFYNSYSSPWRRRYWSSQEVQGYHNFVKIPVFPGK